jgi:hypothetical protein
VAVVTLVEALKDMVEAVDIQIVVKEVIRVDTEIVVVIVTEEVIEVMEAVAVDFIIKVLECPVLLKVILHTCFPIISALKQTHNLKTFTFTKLISVSSMTLKIQILATVLLNPFENH